MHARALVCSALVALPSLVLAHNPAPSSWSEAHGVVIGRFGKGVRIERRGDSFVLGNVAGQVIKSDVPGLGGATKLEVHFDGVQAAQVYALTGAPALAPASGPADSVVANVVFDPTGGVRFDAVTRYGGARSIHHRTSVRLAPQR